jgi:hypothetical protein
MEGDYLMFKDDPNKTFTFEFDENGTNEVSQQIMNSYNSGYIDQAAEQTNDEGYLNLEE